MKSQIFLWQSFKEQKATQQKENGAMQPVDQLRQLYMKLIVDMTGIFLV
jgi:hypothetical protein